MATKYSQPQKGNREENSIHLFTGSIMDPFDVKSRLKMASFHRLRDEQKLPKIVYGESGLKKVAKIKMTGSIIGPAGKKKNLNLKLPARLLVRPWPDQPDRLLRPCFITKHVVIKLQYNNYIVMQGLSETCR